MENTVRLLLTRTYCNSLAVTFHISRQQEANTQASPYFSHFEHVLSQNDGKDRTFYKTVHCNGNQCNKKNSNLPNSKSSARHFAICPVNSIFSPKIKIWSKRTYFFAVKMTVIKLSLSIIALSSDRKPSAGSR